jgi:hypothetical protein
MKYTEHVMHSLIDAEAVIDDPGEFTKDDVLCCLGRLYIIILDELSPKKTKHLKLMPAKDKTDERR